MHPPSGCSKRQVMDRDQSVADGTMERCSAALAKRVRRVEAGDTRSRVARGENVDHMVKSERSNEREELRRETGRAQDQTLKAGLEAPSAATPEGGGRSGSV